jgi:hypothetical protein
MAVFWLTITASGEELAFFALITDFSRGVTRYHAPPGYPVAG